MKREMTDLRHRIPRCETGTAEFAAGEKIGMIPIDWTTNRQNMRQMVLSLSLRLNDEHQCAAD